MQEKNQWEKNYEIEIQRQLRSSVSITMEADERARKLKATQENLKMQESALKIMMAKITERKPSQLELLVQDDITRRVSSAAFCLISTRLA